MTAREDSRSSTAQVWLAGVEPAISGARSRRGGQLPYSQKTNGNPDGTRTRSRPRLRDKDSNLDLHVQSVASCRLDDPGTCKRTRTSVHLPMGDRRSSETRAASAKVFLTSDESRTVFSEPLAYPSTLDR